MFSEELAVLISKKFNLDKSEVLNLIEVPPSSEMGDFAFPCFTLAKALKKSPAQIANENTDFKAKFLKEVKAVGPYINFFLKEVHIMDKFSREFIVKKGKGLEFTFLKELKDKKENVLIESPSPNTNKPLHLGHLRNMLLGQSVYNIYKELGNDVKLTEVVNDKGIHICKSMLAYQLKGEGKTPESEGMKGDFFVGKYYVLFEKLKKKDPSLEEKAQEMLLKWEQGDKEVIKLWNKMRKWCIQGFKESYDSFGMEIKEKERYYESDLYLEGKKIVAEGLKKGVFEKEEDGAIFVDLEDKGLGKKYLQRKDGTSIYITQDIYLGKKRYEEHNMNRMIYVVASEQNYHFKVLFEIFKLLKYKFANNCHHLSYGMVYLPEGRMKSREGNVVDADNLRLDLIKEAEKEVKERYDNLSAKEIEKRSKAIGMGALRFFILKHDAHKDMVYNPKESLSFSGETGPYIQYTYARISSIFKKSNESIKNYELESELLSHKLEKQIVLKIFEYNNVLLKSASEYKPNLICNYLLELSQLTTKYYHEVQIINSNKKVEKARLYLLDSIRHVIKNGLELLGIDVLEEM